jgi:zinc protease
MKTRITIALMLLCALASAQAPPKLKMPSFTKSKLKNGTTLYLLEKHEVPLVSVAFLVKSGSVADPTGKEGVASLTASLLRKGTPTRTADQVSEQLDFLGATFGADASPDMSRGQAQFMKKDAAEGMDILADLLQHPSFPDAEVTKLVAQRVDGVRAAKDRAGAVLDTYFYGYLYGKHPYGRPDGGDDISLKAITRDDVVAFHKAHYTPDNTIITVAGDFSAAEMQKLLEVKFGGWTGKAAPAAALPTPVATTGRRLLLIDKPDSTQTYYEIGNVGVARNNPDRTYINVVNTLFGGRFTSMINTELRIKTGLTYGARSYFDLKKVAGPFAISTYTKNADTEKAMDKTLEVAKRLHDQGITQEELDSAKAYIKGQFPPSIETAGELANLLATLDFYGLDEREVNELYSRIDSMDLATAKRIIQQYFPLESLTFVVIGKASEIEPVVKKYADKVDKKSITQPGF